MAATSSGITGSKDPTSSTLHVGWHDENILDSTRKSLSIFAMMRTPSTETSNVYAIVGRFTIGSGEDSREHQFLNFEEGVPDCPLSNFVGDLPDEDPNFVIQKKHFEVYIPSEYQKNGALHFSVARKDLDAVSNAFLDRKILNSQNIFVTTFNGSDPKPVIISTTFQTKSEAYSILVHDYLKEISKRMTAVIENDAQFTASLEALKKDVSLFGSIENWSIPLLHRLISKMNDQLQNDPRSLAQLSVWADRVKGDQTALPLFKEAFLRLFDTASYDADQLINISTSDMDALCIRLGHLLLSDPQIASAWNALEKDPALLSSAHLWAFPLLHRAVTLVQKDPEAMQSLSAIGHVFQAKIEEQRLLDFQSNIPMQE